MVMPARAADAQGHRCATITRLQLRAGEVVLRNRTVLYEWRRLVARLIRNRFAASERESTKGARRCLLPVNKNPPPLYAVPLVCVPCGHPSGA